jgi:transposase-like protein
MRLSYFIEQYAHKAYLPEIRNQVLKMVVDGTGTRATGRILGISKDTVTAILKKQRMVLASKSAITYVV